MTIDHMDELFDEVSRSGYYPEIVPYVGGYDYFLEKTGAMEDARAALTAA